MSNLKIRMTGVAPLLMHSDRLVDPTNEHTKRVAALARAAKGAKTEAAFAAVQRAEWEGGLYLDDEGRPCLPASNVLAVIVDGAKRSKLGKNAKSGVFCERGSFALEYEGPTDLDELFEQGFVDVRSIKVGQVRVMRCRPKFGEWSCIVELVIVDEVISREQVLRAFETGGMFSGVGDYRPQHGRFTIEVIEDEQPARGKRK